MSTIKAVPKETLSLIPRYDGEENHLNLFLSKCDYVVNGASIEGNVDQVLYLFHAVSSRLTGRAATLLSDHPNIKSYDVLKELLTQHFGDPRSEECIAIELEQLKIKNGETYIQFCHRIQNVRSSLFAKVNRLTDEGIKAAKMIVYNNLALNTFLFNLPEDMIRIVRLKGCTSLENALSIVTEEVNFKFQYDAKTKILKQTTAQLPSAQNSQNTSKPMPAQPTAAVQGQGFKFGIPQNNFRFGLPQNNFRFGIPQNQGGFRPNFVPQMRFAPPPQGFRFGIPQNLPQRNFSSGFQAVPQRAPFQYGGYKFGIPSQNQNKFNAPQQQVQAPRLQETDVSMRTAPIRQNMIANDLYFMDGNGFESEYGYDTSMNDMYGYVEYPVGDCNYIELDGNNSINSENVNTDKVNMDNVSLDTQKPENFQETASKDTVK